MQLEKFEFLQSAAGVVMTILGLIAGVIGAFFNQRMIKEEVKQERIFVNQKWVKLRLWFKMHTTAWWVFIISSALIIPISFAQNFLDGKIADMRDSSLQARYFEQIIFLQERNSEERKETKAENQSNLKEITGNMSMMFAEGLKKGDYNTTYIVKDAGTNKEELRHKMDSLKERQLPNVTYFLKDPPIEYTQSNDTFHIVLTIANYGGSVAKKCNYKLYYLLTDNKVMYEYHEAVSDVLEVEIPPSQAKQTVKGTGTYMTDFHFDPTNQYQYILVLGSYMSQYEDAKPIPLKLCYEWNVHFKKWTISSQLPKIEAAHYDNIKYFKRYPLR